MQPHPTPHSRSAHALSHGGVSSKRIWDKNQVNWRIKQRSDRKRETNEKGRQEDTNIYSNTVASPFTGEASKFYKSKKHILKYQMPWGNIKK